MQTFPKSRLLRFVEAFQVAQRAVARYSSKFSKQRYTLHQHIVLLCLKVRKDTTYRTLLDELIEMPRIRSAINLTELPAPSTLCKAFDRLDMAVWRLLLNLCFTTPDQRCCGDRRIRIRPKSRLEALHKTGEADDSATKSHTLSRYKSKRDPRSPRHHDPKTRYTDRTIAHQPQHG